MAMQPRDHSGRFASHGLVAASVEEAIGCCEAALDEGRSGVEEAESLARAVDSVPLISTSEAARIKNFIERAHAIPTPLWQRLEVASRNSSSRADASRRVLDETRLQRRVERHNRAAP